MPQCAAEIGARDALKFLGQLYRETSGFDDGVSAPAHVDDICVGIVVSGAVARAGEGEQPSAAAIVSETTKRLRYHSALPPQSLRPCTIPAPRNQ
jgi:hypothetical protein